MPKFLVLYRGDVTPRGEMPAVEHDAVMERWGAWLEAHGDDVDDPGFPFGARAAVGGDGTGRPATNLSGYSVIRADSVEAARELCRDHPFLHGGGAEVTVEIFELLPI